MIVIIEGDLISLYSSQNHYISHLNHIKLEKEQELKQKLYEEEELERELERQRIILLNENKIKEIEDSVSAYYGENYELKINGDYIEILLRFPEIEITNSNDFKHNIYDLWIKVILYKNDLKLYSIRGIRSNYSYYEWMKNYGFSHLDNKEYYFGVLCFGSTSLKINIEDLKKEFNLNIFENVLIQLDNYVRWESLEGGPYNKIEDIYKTNSYSWNGNQIDLNISYNNFIKEYSEFPMFLENKEGVVNFKIDILNKDFINKVTKIATKHCYFDSVNNTYFSVEGETLNVDKTIEDIKNTEEFKRKHILFKFKEEDIKINIFKEENKKNNLERVACPEIIKYIANKLSKEVTEFYLK